MDGVSPSQKAEKTAASLLVGTFLDSIRIYSLIIELNFLRLPATQSLPMDIWLKASGELYVSKDPSESTKDNSDFFKDRAAALSRLYLLIGQEVTEVQISAVGMLNIKLGEHYIMLTSEKESRHLEEIWAIMGDPSDEAGYRWYISLDDNGSIDVKAP